MSSAPQEQKPAEPQLAPVTSKLEPDPQLASLKRAIIDDEIEFISSSPVKKQRLSEQKPAPATVQHLLAVPGQKVDINLQNVATPRPTPPDRCRSMEFSPCPSHHVPEAAVENRGVSLPVLNNFVFPQSFPPVIQPPRQSEAISPKQLPQAPPSPPELNVSTGQSFSPAINDPVQKSVGIGHISCLNFNGIPTTTPGFDVSKIFSADGGIIGNLGMNKNGSPSPGIPAFNPSISPNAIPFTMYSTGNIVPMPPAHCQSQLGAPFTASPMPNPFQQTGHSLPGNVRQFQPQPQHLYQQQHQPQYQHQHQNAQAKPQGPQPNPTPNRTPSPGPGSRPPCSHCARLRQETLVRQAQSASSQVPRTTAIQPPQRPTAAHLPSPPSSPTRPGTIPGLAPGSVPTPRSAPASTLSAERHHHQQHHSQLGPPPNTTLAPGAPASVSASAMPIPTPPTWPPLIVDIAERIQATFPYAQVAARHDMAPGKVAEVVSRLVVMPLMAQARGSKG